MRASIYSVMALVVAVAPSAAQGRVRDRPLRSLAARTGARTTCGGGRLRLQVLGYPVTSPPAYSLGVVAGNYSTGLQHDLVLSLGLSVVAP